MKPITNPLFIDFSSEDFCNGRFRCSAFREPEKYTKFTERFVHFECSIFPQEELLETDEERRKEELISLFSNFVTSKEDCLKLREIFLSLFAYNKDVWFHFILRIYSENDKNIVEEWAKELNSLERTKGYVKLLGTYKKTKILIIPDVHGREFWIDAVEKFKDEVSDIVFLGDYLDPYAFEGIGKDSALKRFKDIIELAKSNPKVHLLLGNHDWHYIVNLDTCRLDFENYKEIKDLFAENKDLFKIAWSYENYLFTHAGVTDSWLKHIQFYKPEFKPTPECLNNLDPRFLSEIGYERGGDDRNGGSCLWADIREHLGYFDDALKDTYQIFGHSLAYPNLDEAYIDENLAMLDSRRAWILDTETKKLEDC